MADFKLAYSKIEIYEGGYSNHASDLGLETYAGISRKFFPKWGGWPKIDGYKLKPNFPANIDKALLKPLVMDFFKVQFWDDLRLNEFTSQDIADELLDIGVNMGTSRAARLAQEAFNLIDRSSLTLTVDGIIGSKTINAINNYISPKTLFNLLNVLQGERYVELVRATPSQDVFLKGWLTRITILK